MFRQMRFFLPIAAQFGLGARMTADEHAQVNIDANEIGDASGPVLERLTCPVRFVLATGDSAGASGGAMDQGRAVLDPIFAQNPNVQLFAKVASNHTQVLRKDSPAVAEAVRRLVADLKDDPA
jgi:hypothetical protein